MNYSKVITMVMGAQRAFNHQLLIELIESGALTRDAALRIPLKASEFMQETEGDLAANSVSDAIAKGFEQVAASIAGLPPIAPPK